MSSIKRSLLGLTIFICSSLYAQNTPRTIHVFVALCDNVHQGIVPVSKTLGNGEDPRNNLYWGALYGVKTFFKRSENWKLQSTEKNPTSEIMERCIFKHQSGDVYLVADAYRGREIRKTTDDFFQAAAGNNKEFISVEVDNEQVSLGIGGNSGLIAYVGHDALMDFDLENYPTIILRDVKPPAPKFDLARQIEGKQQKKRPKGKLLPIGDSPPEQVWQWTEEVKEINYQYRRCE